MVINSINLSIVSRNNVPLCEPNKCLSCIDPVFIDQDLHVCSKRKITCLSFFCFGIRKGGTIRPVKPLLVGYDTGSIASAASKCILRKRRRKEHATNVPNLILVFIIESRKVLRFVESARQQKKLNLNKLCEMHSFACFFIFAS